MLLTVICSRSARNISCLISCQDFWKNEPKYFSIETIKYFWKCKPKYFFYTLLKRSRLKSTFLQYRVKKHHSTLEMDTFKGMWLLSYLDSLDNKPRTWLWKYISRYRNNYCCRFFVADRKIVRISRLFNLYSKTSKSNLKLPTQKLVFEKS